MGSLPQALFLQAAAAARALHRPTGPAAYCRWPHELHAAGERTGANQVLGQKFKVGKRFRGRYVKAVLDTQRGLPTAYPDGRVFKGWDDPLLNQ